MICERFSIVCSRLLNSQTVLQNVDKAQVKLQMKKDNVAGWHGLEWWLCVLDTMWILL